MFGCTSKSITALKTEWNEEKSYSFLNFFITYQNWCTYSTKKLSHSEVLVLSDLFCLSHGKVAPKQDSELAFWSVHPMNIFRFKLLDNLDFSVLNYPDPAYDKPGYIVEGCYWVNGFMYQVLEEDSKNLLELNLLIDKPTQQIYDYPNVFTPINDLINEYITLPS